MNRDYCVTHKSKDIALHYNFHNPEITSPWVADHICIEGREQLYLLGIRVLSKIQYRRDGISNLCLIIANFT